MPFVSGYVLWSFQFGSKSIKQTMQNNVFQNRSVIISWLVRGRILKRIQRWEGCGMWGHYCEGELREVVCSWWRIWDQLQNVRQAQISKRLPLVRSRIQVCSILKLPIHFPGSPLPHRKLAIFYLNSIEQACRFRWKHSMALSQTLEQINHDRLLSGAVIGNGIESSATTLAKLSILRWTLHFRPKRESDWRHTAARACLIVSFERKTIRWWSLYRPWNTVNSGSFRLNEKQFDDDRYTAHETPSIPEQRYYWISSRFSRVS